MLKIASIFLVAVGALVLLLALARIRQIRAGVATPDAGWRWLFYLVVFFVITYALFGVMLFISVISVVEMVAAIIMLVGAGFVLLVSQLSLQAIREVNHIANLERHRAQHDYLTELPNRVFLTETLDDVLETARKQEGSLAILVMDLDRFKEINDTLGHYVGDLLLQEIAPRLRQAIRQADVVARMGGDEFAVLLPSVDMEGARAVSRKIAEILRPSIQVEEHLLDVGISIGIAMFPDHGVSSDVLLQKADVAMYMAKRAEQDFAVYDPAEDHYSVNRLMLTGELREALANEDLYLLYQPKINLASGSVCGVEALVRWKHPRLGEVYPDEFIGLAEQSGLIRPLSLWVLNTAMRQVAIWEANGISMPVSVNLSTKDLMDPAFPEQLQSRLLAWNVKAESITLEITESSMLEDPERSMEIIRRVDMLGFGLSIDDFGTGFSSLSYLKQLPPTEIKIDKSFVMDMTVDDNDAVIVRSIIDLAHNMGRKVVAEGVENRDIQDLLEILGCDMIQGYHICRPVSALELEKWLHEGGRKIC